MIDLATICRRPRPPSIERIRVTQSRDLIGRGHYNARLQSVNLAHSQVYNPWTQTPGPESILRSTRILIRQHSESRAASGSRSTPKLEPSLSHSHRPAERAGRPSLPLASSPRHSPLSPVHLPGGPRAGPCPPALLTKVRIPKHLFEAIKSSNTLVKSSDTLVKSSNTLVRQSNLFEAIKSSDTLLEFIKWQSTLSRHAVTDRQGREVGVSLRGDRFSRPTAWPSFTGRASQPPRLHGRGAALRPWSP